MPTRIIKLVKTQDLDNPAEAIYKMEDISHKESAYSLDPPQKSSSEEEILRSLPQALKEYIISCGESPLSFSHLSIITPDQRLSTPGLRTTLNLLHTLDLPEETLKAIRFEVLSHLAEAEKCLGEDSVLSPFERISRNIRSESHEMALTELVDIIRCAFYREFSRYEPHSQYASPIFELLHIYDDVVLAREVQSSRHVVIPYQFANGQISFGEPRFVRIDYSEYQEPKSEDVTAAKQSTEIQSLIFDKKKFSSPDDALAWAKEHGFRSDKVDETRGSFRVRQFPPSHCRSGSYRVITLTDGVKAVICRKRKTQKTAEESTLQAMAIEFNPDVDARDNRHPFAAVLFHVNRLSDSPPNGAGGHRIYIPRDVAEKSLSDLIGMPVNADPTLSRHNEAINIGVVTSAEIVGDEVVVKGYLFDRNLPDLIHSISSLKDQLGCSFEADVGFVLQNINGEEVFCVTHFSPLGLSILLKENAAYKTTRIIYAETTPQQKEEPMEEIKALLDSLNERLTHIESRLTEVEARSTEEKSTNATTVDAKSLAQVIAQAIKEALRSPQPVEPFSGRTPVKVAVKGADDRPPDIEKAVEEIEAAIRFVQASASLSPVQKLAELDKLAARKRELVAATR